MVQHDDITKEALAECFGKRLVRDDSSLERIGEYFAQIGAEISESNARQAMLPEGCVVLDNDWGTAPGCAFEADGKHVIMLPGPPRECEPMFKERAVPYLRKLSDSVLVSRNIRIFGMGESAVEDILHEYMQSQVNPQLHLTPRKEVMIRVTAKAEMRRRLCDDRTCCGQGC